MSPPPNKNKSKSKKRHGGKKRKFVRILPQVVFDFTAFDSATDLERLGADAIKQELSKLGLKCGGTLQQRCQRFFLLKNTGIAALPLTNFVRAPKPSKLKQPEKEAVALKEEEPEPEQKPAEDSEPSLKHSFDVDPDDHCETPLEAYEDIAAVLEQAAVLMGKTKQTVKIYDPYFCAGSVVKHLNSVGFQRVTNRNQDCYQAWQQGTTPDFDIIVTNPPYSGDHPAKLIEFCMRHGKPWFLLVPSFVHKKDYYKPAEQTKPFYLLPKKRYIYLPPPGLRLKKKSDTQKKTSPFVSMWCCHGGEANSRLVHWVFQQHQQWDKLNFARSKSALRDLRRKKK